MAQYYEACPRCGRTNFGEILHCKRCGSEFCTVCIGKRTFPDGTPYKCCPRCGAEYDDEDDDAIYVVVTEKENARNKR